MVLLAAAGYSSRQTKIHRDIEQQMRWFALEVKAIDPFLSSLDDADQKELKKHFSEKLFGRDRSSTSSPRGKAGISEAKDIPESLISALTDLLKAAGKGAS